MVDLISIQIKGVLENAIFNRIIAFNTGVSNSTLRAVVSRVAELSAVIVTQSVNTNANQQLNVIPTNLVGLKNPVNLVTGNLGSQGVSNNLNNVLNTQLNLQIADKIATLLERELKNVLPPGRSGIINYSALAATLVSTLYPTIAGTIGTALKGFTDGVFGRGISTPPVIPDVDTFFSTSPDTALDRVDDFFSSTVANKYLQQAKTFNVNSTTNQEKLEVTKVGFTDPTANYPTKEYSGKSETNKLAQGDVRGTIVQEKNAFRMLGAKLPGGEAWDQPESPFKGVYPFNKVTQTESGHVIEMDDTPGAERLHIYHKSGTFIEIDANGSVVKRAVGSSYEIIDRNGKIAISGSADISVNGACNIFVGNDANIEVEGDTNLTCHNDITAQAGGKLNLSAVEELNITSANVNIQAYNVMNVTSNVALSLHSSNVMYMHSNVNMQMQSVDFYNKTSGTMYNQAGGEVNFKSTGNFNVDGDNVYLNSGTADESKDGVIAGISNIGILPGRKDITDNSQKDPTFVNLSDAYALKLEEEPQTNEEYLAHRDLILTSGFATAEEFDIEPVEDITEDPETTQTQMIEGTQSLLYVSELPGNFNLSPNFTVEMLSFKGVITNDFIEEDSTIKYGQIVYNLQQVALNLLEPAYNLYPNLVVASGFRTKSNSSGGSLHPQGKAVDIILQGFDKDDVYDAAVQLAKNLNYDQLILEFCNYSKVPWIHMSYQGASNRKEVLTFWNNKRYGTGLIKLV